jgi:biotin carboxyl carrier protein
MSDTHNPPIQHGPGQRVEQGIPVNGAAPAMPDTSTPPAAKPGVKKRWLYLILVVMFLFVLMPYLFWQATWFGKPLNDAQMTQAFADTQHPRNAQHALSQIADHMENPDPAVRATAKPWYPQAIAAASSSESALRSTAAWIMGKDPGVPEFHETLQKLLADSDPMVQRNAALSLVRFGDVSGHDMIVAMLKPWVQTAPVEGKLSVRLTPGETVSVGTLIGRIETAAGKVEIRTKMPGTLDQWTVKDGTPVIANQPIAQLDPAADVVLNALAALYFVGHTDDIPTITPYLRVITGMPLSVSQQATLTLNAIQTRADMPATAKP